MDDDKRLAAICRIPVSEWISLRPALEEFFDVTNGFWNHKRIESELSHVNRQQRQRSNAGKASANARKHKDNLTVVERPLSKRSTKPDTDTDTDKDKIKTKGRFTPPSVEEVTSYCQQRNNTIDPSGFIDHYQANGWMRGKAKIKDWKACVRTWEKNAIQKQKPKKAIGDKRIERLKRQFAQPGDDGSSSDLTNVPELTNGKGNRRR